MAGTGLMAISTAAATVAAEGRIRALIVDDEPDMLHLLRDLLRMTFPNWEFDTARNAKEALDKVAASPPSLLISDFLMPGIDGLTLAGRLREDGHRFPIILMTAFVDSGLPDRVAESGFVQWFARKPVRPEELADKIRELMGAA